MTDYLNKKGKIDTALLLRDMGVSANTVDGFAQIAKDCASMARNGATVSTIKHMVLNATKINEKQTLNDTPSEYAVYGEFGTDIDYGAKEQMDTLARLPMFGGGCLLPDAHQGYAMPVGGVAVLNGAVSPYCVGVDIGCRMALTIFDISPEELKEKREYFFDVAKSVTRFGFGGFESGEREHSVMDDELWNDPSLPLKNQKEKAQQQLGSSGGGNHFVDLVTGVIKQDAPFLPHHKVGDTFAGLLTHSGSRGVGHRMATHYTKLAQEVTKRKTVNVPKELAWLEIDTDAGREYLEVMTLMGKYAKANHDLIHKHFLQESSIGASGRIIENFHNFAWVDGEKVVHRKGATPAYKGQPGLIPGSSGTASYLVSGLGNPDSIESCSHGAGRPFSRTEAKKRHDDIAFRSQMQANDIWHSGVNTDETYQAYKDINRVIELQKGELVEVIAEMMPVAVLMGGKSDDGD